MDNSIIDVLRSLTEFNSRQMDTNQMLIKCVTDLSIRVICLENQLKEKTES